MKIKKLLPYIGLAFVFWFILFFPAINGHTNFWLLMAIFDAVLLLAILPFRKDIAKDIHLNWPNVVLAVLLAVVLWLVFFVGDKVSCFLLPFADEQIGAVYDIKSGSNANIIALLLFLLIGPTEELFWRGFIQNQLSKQYSPNKAMILTIVFYTLIHISSLNFMLIMSALVAGAFWGVVYRLFPKYLLACVISHALWDACVFIVFPI